MKTAIIILLMGVTSTFAQSQDSAGRYLQQSAHYKLTSVVASSLGAVVLTQQKQMGDMAPMFAVVCFATSLYCEVSVWVSVRRAGKALRKRI